MINDFKKLKKISRNIYKTIKLKLKEKIYSHS